MLSSSSSFRLLKVVKSNSNNLNNFVQEGMKKIKICKTVNPSLLATIYIHWMQRELPWNCSWFIGSYVDFNGKCRPLMCKNSENGAKLPISRKSCGWVTTRGPPRWRHGQRALACGAILRNGTGPARVGQQWRALGARCNGWIALLRAPQARGVTGLQPGKPLVNQYSWIFDAIVTEPIYEWRPRMQKRTK